MTPLSDPGSTKVLNVNSKDLIELAGNPNFISGIYNYCDRWCERCPFTSRCLVYASEKEDDEKDPESRDINNAAFWQRLTSIFEETREMITAWAEENGVDLDTPEAQAAKEEHDREMEDAHNHELTLAAEDYASQLHDWFENEFGIETSDDSGKAAELNADAEEDKQEASEVLHWYQFQIAAKIVRGLMSRDDDDESEEEEDNISRDSDGSIKVALIGMDRSISAWRLMQLAAPDKSDSIVPLILALEALRHNTERAFPQARDFIRPGFDEVSDTLIQ
ncbi:MAG TPA: hypothetical protein VN643_06820 [Pyrinomonadaceae bacterium]|nr:hypothetical protein [Pyrinomonadaceae bacterium]